MSHPEKLVIFQERELLNSRSKKKKKKKKKKKSKKEMQPPKISYSLGNEILDYKIKKNLISLQMKMKSYTYQTRLEK